MIMDDPFSDFSGLLLTYLAMLPFLLVYLAGMVLSFVYWQRYPKVCLLSFLGTALLFFQAVAGTFLERGLIHSLAWNDGDPFRFDMLLFILTILRSFLIAGAWIMILFAIFGWREQRRQVSYREEPDRPEPRRWSDEPQQGYPPSAFRE